MSVFDGVNGGIIGALQSDNGAFGATHVIGLTVTLNRFLNCTGSPFELGATIGAIVTENLCYNNATYGMIVFGGHTPVSAQNYGYTISQNIYIDNNNSNISSTSAPGILFSALGGVQSGSLLGNIFLDTRGTPKQLYPISFINAFTWSGLTIEGNVLNAYSGGLSVGVSAGAVLGSDVQLGPGNIALTASLPAGLAVTRIPAGLARAYVLQAYSASITINAKLGGVFRILATDAVAFTINAPTNPTLGQRITIRIENGSGGALGAVTWNAIFKMTAWTQPADVFSRSIDFEWNGGNWVESGRTAADVPR